MFFTGENSQVDYFLTVKPDICIHKKITFRYYDLWEFELSPVMFEFPAFHANSIWETGPMHRPI